MATCRELRRLHRAFEYARSDAEREVIEEEFFWACVTASPWVRLAYRVTTRVRQLYDEARLCAEVVWHEWILRRHEPIEEPDAQDDERAADGDQLNEGQRGDR